MTVFALPLPPSSNHGYKQVWHWNRRKGRMQSRPGKTNELVLWEDKARIILGGYAPPEHTRLRLDIDIYVPAVALRTEDLSGFLKFLEDAVVGNRRDQWIDHEALHRYPAEGCRYVEALRLAHGLIAGKSPDLYREIVEQRRLAVVLVERCP